MRCIIVYGKTEEEYLQNVEKVLARLDEFNLTINPDKAKLGLTEVEYVGHTINQQGMKFTRERLDKFVRLPKPQTWGDMKEFLGRANYFRDHVQNQGIELQPLSEAMKNYTKKRRKREFVRGVFQDCGAEDQ